MSVTPPDPGFPQSLQDRIALGTLAADKSITISGVTWWLALEDGSGANSAQWAIINPTTDTTSVRFLVSGPTTFAAMQSGTVNANGSITVSGVTHYVRFSRASGGSNQAVWTA